uniref:SQUAMOSA PROMOTER BINDING protein-LIKE 7 n=1 Tax=Populus alba TaxID=43335 RepID=A0A4U5Q652_POPAL|nr:SQUAMOSA PROMOTER BINDING protein-LIKE 7 [Populus alba]
METSSPSPPPPPSASQHGGDMEIHHPPITTDWDWSDLLDFAVEDQIPVSFDALGDPTQTIDNPTPEIESQQVQLPVPDRVRKRDPRLTCSNFLAGIVPCACPEVDELLREEEATLPGKKRVRVARAGSSIARCQVPGCETDISELKGYHRRHKVCLRCATATAVVLDEQTKRYCQQCGKFHVLSDFDEGKRSCRRKLERHNNRRRRKPADSSKASAGDKEVQGDLLTEDTTTCDAEAEKDGLCSSGQMAEKEGLVESEDGHVSTINSDPNSQNVTSDSGVSFTAFGDMLMDGGKDDSKFSFSPSNCDNKSDYASMCPTGRISFKLYDWNPAEFPRRLRHQIFQWLANMPVELEGYIRPGCTILTAFIAMPTFMWVKLVEDPVSYLNDLLGSGKMLSKKGRMRVYVNNMIFNVTKDGNSVMKVNVEGHAPRLHYVHPTCFEAGKPIELVVCGSNLLQPKFQFLVSFAGKYLAHDYCVALPQAHTKGGPGLHHQLCKILTHCNEPNLLGPAFIEVENESGLSNYIPILIGDTEICSEMKIIQQRFDASHSLIIGSECEVSTMRQTALSEFIMDIAWLLKEPSAEYSQQMMTSFQIQRINSLLNFLLHHESIIILDRILKNLKIMMDKKEANGMINGTSDTNMRLLQSYMDYASNIRHEKLQRSEVLKHHLEFSGKENNCISGSCCGNNKESVALYTEDLEQRPNGVLGVMGNSNSIARSDEFPLLTKDVMRMNLVNEKPKKSCGLVFSNTVLKYRPSFYVIALIAVCFGVCAIVLHPHKVSKLAVSIRRSIKIEPRPSQELEISAAFFQLDENSL